MIRHLPAISTQFFYAKQILMKQNVFVSILSVCLVFLATAAFGQRTVVSPDHAAGTFEAAKATGEPMSVRYTLAPAFPDNLVFQLVPAGEFQLNAHITDAKGAEVLLISPQTVTGRYANSLDVSKLTPGKYFIEVFGATGKEGNYRIPFNIGTK